MEKLPPEPHRVLQYYDREKQAQFADMPPQARLEWLEAINRLYWLGVQWRQAVKQGKKAA